MLALAKKLLQLQPGKAAQQHSPPQCCTGEPDVTHQAAHLGKYGIRPGGHSELIAQVVVQGSRLLARPQGALEPGTQVCQAGLVLRVPLHSTCCCSAVTSAIGVAVPRAPQWNWGKPTLLSCPPH